VSSTEELGRLFAQMGYADFKWLDPAGITVARWVRMKCMFGCGSYGTNATCPPSVPTVGECEQFFREYRRAAVFHFSRAFEKPENRHGWTRKVNRELLKLERAVFLAGNPRAFLLFMDTCGFCAECAGERSACKEPRAARPTPEAMAVDVFSTVRAAGYEIEVLTDTSQVMNRFAFLMVE
jgi:predicted metal-binding protein